MARFERIGWLVKTNLLLFMLFYLLKWWSASDITFFKNTIYPFLNSIYGLASAIVGLVGLALFDVILGLALLLLVMLIWQSCKSYRKLRSFLLLPFKVLTIILFLAIWFQVSWGFFYQQKLFQREKKQAENSNVRASPQHKLLYAKALVKLNQLEKQLALGEVKELNQDFFRPHVKKLIAALNSLPTSAFTLAKGHDPFRPGSLSYILNWVGASGMYSPVSHELFIGKAVPPLARLFVATHELAHLMGYAREDDAEIAAFMALRQSKEPILQFAALYYVVLHAPLDSSRQAHLKELPLSVQNDLAQGFLLRKKYPPHVAKFAWAIYNVFLKSQGIKEGVASYGVVGRLINARPDLIRPLIAN